MIMGEIERFASHFPESAITPADLLAAGYRSFGKPRHNLSDDLYQKWIRDADGYKLYAINWYLYQYPNRRGWGVEVTLYRGKRETFQIEYNVEPDFVIEDVEAFYRDAYRVLCCCIDRHNN
jgi:hypothetical protein